MGWLLRLAATAALAGGLLTAQAQAAHRASPTILVTFFIDGSITVTLPDGTPVGATSGSPTVIPAGYYTVLMDGPGGCIQLPLFELRGPGANIVSDMNGGEVDASNFNAFFLPNSTYTWRTDRGVSSSAHTFTTSGTIAATSSGQTATTPVTSSGKPTSNDVVGSGLAPYRGTLTAAVSPTGTLSVQHHAPSMKAGRYRLSVTDRSTSRGILLQKGKAKPVSLTGAAFVGKRTATVTLTAGTWRLTPGPGKAAVKLVVH